MNPLVMIPQVRARAAALVVKAKVQHDATVGGFAKSARKVLTEEQRQELATLILA